ncbi:hypothetical protein Tco_0974981 [Tanacetum coccineum]|uniref:Uncharacterized protein n=1 Tax=Tanacetum coccineum TaxID=301880 RepID=A0ABQ5ED29_9ASTR
MISLLMVNVGFTNDADDDWNIRVVETEMSQSMNMSSIEGKSSSERKKMSKPLKIHQDSVTTTPIRGATSSGPNRCIDQQASFGYFGERYGYFPEQEFFPERAVIDMNNYEAD